MCVKPKSETEQPVYQEFILKPEDFNYWEERWWARVEQYYNQM
jgi:hypothetical protein